MLHRGVTEHWSVGQDLLNEVESKKNPMWVFIFLYLCVCMLRFDYICIVVHWALAVTVTEDCLVKMHSMKPEAEEFSKVAAGK